MFFGKPDILAEGTNADIDTVEEDIVSVANQLAPTQLSMYVSVSLGTHTTLDIRVYTRGENNGTWHQLIKRNISSGLIIDDSYQFNSSSPTSVVVDLPISAALELKVTGQGTGGLNGSATVRLLTRNN